MTTCNSCDEEIHFDDWHVSAKGKKIPLDSDDTPHDCPAREPFVISCRKCQKDITFDDDHVSSSGKKIPLDADTLTAHNCTAETKTKVLNCNKCGNKIYFDPMAAKSISNKMIPQDFTTLAPHQCS